MRNVRIIEKIEEILNGETMTTARIYDKLQDAKAKVKGTREKRWKHTPSKGQVKNILSSYSQFKRVNDGSPAIWTYENEEE